MKTIVEQDKDLKRETFNRKRRMRREFEQKPVIKLFKNIHGYNQMIAQVGIPFSALCEHHEVAFEGEVSIAYIPDKYLTGLSKLARIAEYYLNPTVKTIQEKATHQILKDIVDTLKPIGAMVVIKARHNCICYRGVKKPSITITSAIYGGFEENPITREEFLSFIK
jgi:GTP cyclohydrolase I